MTGVTYGLADFVTGGPILDLPVMEGATWAAQLNRPDSLTATVDLNDADAASLDLRSSTEPYKTVMIARTDDDVILAWGMIGPREWDEDNRTLSLTATGIRGAGYFGRTIVAPSTADTATLIAMDGDGYPVVNPALNLSYTSLSLGTIGKRLVQARLAWAGAPGIYPAGPFVLPSDESGSDDRDYNFSALQRVDRALDDLADAKNGPDFAFDAQRAPDGLKLLYVMRRGTIAQPRIGTDIGSWSLGPMSPLVGLKYGDDPTTIGSTAWLTAGKSAGAVLISRKRNPSLVTSGGYPPLDIVDTSHNDVKKQTTLDAFADDLIDEGKRPAHTVSFSVRGDATPGIGQYRPGDTATIDVPDDHPYLSSFAIRITSVSGDETGHLVKIGCVKLDD